MKRHLNQLTQRRHHLQALITNQRIELGQYVEPFRVPLARVDQGVEVVRFVQRNTLLVAGASTLYMVFRTKGTGKWLRRSLLAWQLARRFLRK